MVEMLCSHMGVHKTMADLTVGHHKDAVELDQAVRLNRQDKEEYAEAMLDTDHNLKEMARWAAKLRAMLRLVMRQQKLAEAQKVFGCCAKRKEPLTLPIWLKSKVVIQILKDLPEAKAHLRFCDQCQYSQDGLTSL